MSDFKLEFEASFFEKAGEDKDKKWIGGIASMETKDQQAETLIQKGLDFSKFLQVGWFNDNHSKATDAILGYPTEAKYFSKGTKREVKPPAISEDAKAKLINGRYGIKVSLMFGTGFRKMNGRMMNRPA